MDLKAHFLKDRYAEHSGIELLEIGGGRAVARMAMAPFHFNSVGTAHGGAIFTLADFAFAAASNSHGTIALAINVSISFMTAVTRGDAVLTADAREISRNAKLASYTVTVTDEKDVLIAIFQGMVYRKKETIQSLYDEGQIKE